MTRPRDALQTLLRVRRLERDARLQAQRRLSRARVSAEDAVRASDDTAPSLHSGLDEPDTSSEARQPHTGRESEADLPFTRLAHYKIEACIGRGGMGDVYRGYEPELDRTVAIKVLPQNLAQDEGFVRRFRKEATAVAKLSHPNIIQIYFIGEDAGHHFFAMQHVDGESLAELLARKRQLAQME